MDVKFETVCLGCRFPLRASQCSGVEEVFIIRRVHERRDGDPVHRTTSAHQPGEGGQNQALPAFSHR